MTQKKFTVTTLTREDFDFMTPEEYNRIPDKEMAIFAERIQQALLDSGVWADCMEKFEFEVREGGII